MVRIGIAQINTTVGDFSGNVEKMIRMIESAEQQDVDMIVFPELAVCGYPPEDLLYKKHFIAQNLKSVTQLKKYSKNMTIIVGCVDRDSEGRIYNAAAVLNHGAVAGIYHKECLPNYGVFDEKRYFYPGVNNPLFRFGKTRLAVNICEDVWDDHGPHQWQAQAGIDVMINLSASPYDLGKSASRRMLFRRRARQSRSFVCYANVVGGQDEIIFDGGSCIVDPRGKSVAQAEFFQEDFLVFDIPDAAEKKRLIKSEIVLYRPQRVAERAFRHQPANIPDASAAIYQALVLGTHDYIHKNGFHKAVIGLSGGIDSALVAQIAVDALGKERVIGVTMPSCYTSTGTHEDTYRLASNLGIELKEIPIVVVFDAYLALLQTEFAGLPRDITEENIQARIRGNILMALSNKYGWLVLTTGNKSEMAVGYCTLYGDMSGGFAVIKDVYKTKIYELARYRNALDGRDSIPQSILDRAPSAELRENQKDQDSLPPYDVLDQILIAYIERYHSCDRIIRDMGDEDTVKRVLNLVDRAEYKRRQSPPGIKITPRAFGKDWRLPITNKYKHD